MGQLSLEAKCSESTNEKNWEEYQAELNKELKRKLSKNSEKGSIQNDVLDHYTLKTKPWTSYGTLSRETKETKENKERGIIVQKVEELEQFIELLKNC
ncbi:16065_t:CDS:2 [Gigaspora margarita]|uniref:16065_t:CDS:1 n=1 Tax=Gigaspora margarita TaxID=4874 RepID=A0ABN7VQQ0_GIGMA|nr:16065_t:CDS:2 [Gigaspora margarita]